MVTKFDEGKNGVERSVPVALHTSTFSLPMGFSVRWEPSGKSLATFGDPSQSNGRKLAITMPAMHGRARERHKQRKNGKNNFKTTGTTSKKEKEL
jgi:hypothetical protein